LFFFFYFQEVIHVTPGWLEKKGLLLTLLDDY